MSGEYREGVERDFKLFPWITEDIMLIGVDPGAKNTGLVVTRAEIPVFAATIVKDSGETPVEYAIRVAEETKNILEEYVSQIVGVESVNAPKGFSRIKGKGATPINPGHLVMTGIVFGAVAQMIKSGNHNVTFINPRGNGSRHLSNYPDTLKGRRTEGLPGASNSAGRGHEQSAYDIALKAGGLI